MSVSAVRRVAQTYCPVDAASETYVLPFPPCTPFVSCAMRRQLLCCILMAHANRFTSGSLPQAVALLSASLEPISHGHAFLPSFRRVQIGPELDLLVTLLVILQVLRSTGDKTKMEVCPGTQYGVIKVKVAERGSDGRISLRPQAQYYSVCKNRLQMGCPVLIACIRRLAKKRSKPSLNSVRTWS